MSIVATDRRLEVRGARVIIHCEYDPDLVRGLKLVRGVRWDGHCWSISAKLDYLRALAPFAKVQGFSCPVELHDLSVRLVEEAKANREGSRAAEASQEVEGLGGTLAPYQKAAVAYVVRNKRALIGDEMGLGKTVEALASVHAMNTYPCVIVCPASLLYNWEKESRFWIPGKSVHVIDGCAPKPADVTVISYSALLKHVEALRVQGVASVVCDEFHYVRNRKTQRAAAVRALVNRVPVRLGLTGTPIENGDPAELMAQLEILGRLKDFGGPQSFLKDYCQAKLVPTFIRGCERIGPHPVETFDWSTVRIGDEVFTRDKHYCRSEVKERTKGGIVIERHGYRREIPVAELPLYVRIIKRLDTKTGDPAKLRVRLREVCMIRRTKDQVLTELPAKRRVFVPIAINNVEEYRHAQKDVLDWIARRAQEDPEFRASIAGMSQEQQLFALCKRAQEAAERADKAKELVKIGILQQLSAKGKLPAVIDWIRSFLESGQSLVLFGIHNEPLREIASEFKVPVLCGETSSRERQNMVDRFQSGDLRLLPGNVEAGGVGITLTRASHVAFLEEHWLPTKMDQAEDRIHRRGQTLPCTAWYFFGRGTLDAGIHDLVDAKRQVAAEILR